MLELQVCKLDLENQTLKGNKAQVRRNEFLNQMSRNKIDSEMLNKSYYTNEEIHIETENKLNEKEIIKFDKRNFPNKDKDVNFTNNKNANNEHNSNFHYRTETSILNNTNSNISHLSDLTTPRGQSQQNFNEKYSRADINKYEFILF